VDLNKIHCGTVAALKAVPRLTFLDLGYNPVGDDGAAALARAGFLSGLEELKLPLCEIGPDGIGAITASPLVENLVALDLERNGRGQPLEVLRASKRLRRLARLKLDGWNFCAEGAEVLAGWPRLAQLTSLGLSW